MTGSDSPARVSASPMSCMSRKPLTWVPPSAAAQALRSSRKVSGPKVVKAKNPSGARTRRISRSAASRSSHHCSIRLLNIRSTAPSLKGSWNTSPQTRCRGRSQPLRRRVSRSMPSAGSSAITSRAAVAVLQLAGALTGAAAQIHDHRGGHADQVQPRQQLLAHPGLQHRGRIVAGAGAIEGRAHRAPIQDEGIRRLHAAVPGGRRAAAMPASASISASTCCSVWAADSVMRSRAEPRGTVGGRIAATQNPAANSCSLTARARALLAEHHRLDGRERRQQRRCRPAPRRAAGAPPAPAPARGASSPPLATASAARAAAATGWRQCRRVDVAARGLQQPLDVVRIAGNEGAEAAKGLAERADEDGHRGAVQIEMFQRSRGPSAP